MKARHFGVTSTINLRVRSVSVADSVTSMCVSLNWTVVAPQLTDSVLPAFTSNTKPVTTAPSLS